LDSMEKPPFSIGTVAPTPKLVDQYGNASTGTGDEGETDHVGPWNEGKGIHIVGPENSNELDVRPYDPIPGTEKTSRVDSTPVGDRKILKHDAGKTKKEKVA